MKFGLNLPPFGDLADPRTLASLARAAEDAGWDGFFIWDHMIFDPTFHPIVDPWVGLAAVAAQTSRIRLGTLITPVARRRPWKLARETASLDRLSGGRLILGVGLGDPVQWDFGFFGEPVDARLRAQQLDEGLEILSGLWRGERFKYDGAHYQLQEMVFLPRPVQAQRIPIWVGGYWPRRAPMRRAARWDGVVPGGLDRELTPADWQALSGYVLSHRTSTAPFDFVHTGETPGEDPVAATEIVAAYAQVGITWWIENISPWRFGWKWEDKWTPEATELMRRRILQGPPRLYRT